LLANKPRSIKLNAIDWSMRVIQILLDVCEVIIIATTKIVRDTPIFE